MYKRCAYCNKRYEYTGVCSCKIKMTKEKNKVRYKKYDEAKEKKYREFYKKSKWVNLRDLALNRCNYLDLYSLYIFNKIEAADVVHHIVELNEDFSKGLDLNNLIGLTYANHTYIHALYKSNKKETQKLLFYLLNKHIKRVGGV